MADDEKKCPDELQAELEALRKKVSFLETVWDSIPHPFYVIDVKTFRILEANEASGFRRPGAPKTCHALTHGRAEPCGGDDHPCPVQEILRTGEPVTVEHIHFDEKAEPRYVEVHGFPVRDASGRIHQIVEFSQDITRRKEAEQAKAQTLRDLQIALNEVKSLSGLLPICASCKKIRDDRGYWQQLESYIATHSEADFSHSLCPDCATELYGHAPETDEDE